MLKRIKMSDKFYQHANVILSVQLLKLNIHCKGEWIHAFS